MNAADKFSAAQIGVVNGFRDRRRTSNQLLYTSSQLLYYDPATFHRGDTQRTLHFRSHNR
jgi:hypothetical protein